MLQMYKIYMNDTPLYLKEAAADAPIVLENTETRLSGRYTGSIKSLLNYSDMLEKGQRFESVTLYAHDVNALQQDLLSLFTLIEASGGIVRTPEGKVLLIYRLNHWDLPKGKLETGESPAEGAVREVEEETGITGIRLGALVDTTYHTYRIGKNKRILKRTYWYEMEATEQPLVPQTEEDIEQAVWVHPAPFIQDSTRPFYRSIRDLLQKYTESADSGR